MIEFTFKDKKYYKDNKQISYTEITNILNKYQIKKLHETGLIKMRSKGFENKVSNDDKVLKKVKDDYKTSTATYSKTGFVNELYRKHSRYGYWQLVCYLENLEKETINKAILEDVKSQALIAKNKRVVDLDDI